MNFDAVISQGTIALQVEWKAEENRPVKPQLLGTKVFKDYAVGDVVDYIDWNPFFQVSGRTCYDTTFLPNVEQSSAFKHWSSADHQSKR